MNSSNEEKKPLAQFYAVTETSIYHVESLYQWAARATKVALKGESELVVGYDLTKKGVFSMIGIGTVLQSYIPEKYGMTNPLTGFERDYWMINTRYWGPNSSRIVALFLDRMNAETCLQQADLQPCDQRWLDSTKAVLQAIGDDHPSFFVSHHDDALLPATSAV